MKKSLLFLLPLSLAGLFLNCVNSDAQQRKFRGFSINTGRDKTITDCGQITMRVDDLQVVRSEQERTLPKSEVTSLQIQAALHGGIQVSGWDRDHYAIKACLGAAGDRGAEIVSAACAVGAGRAGDRDRARRRELDGLSDHSGSQWRGDGVGSEELADRSQLHHGQYCGAKPERPRDAARC